MNNLEASLEILKVVVAQEDFKNSNLEEKTHKISDLFQIIYKKLSETTGEVNSQEVASRLIANTQSGVANTQSGGGEPDPINTPPKNGNPSGGGAGDSNTGSKDR